MPEKQTGYCEVIRVGITYSCYHELYLLLNALEFNKTGSNTWYRDIISQLSSRRLLLLQAAEGQLHVPHTALDEVIKAPWHTPAGSVEVKSGKQPRRPPNFSTCSKMLKSETSRIMMLPCPHHSQVKIFSHALVILLDISSFLQQNALYKGCHCCCGVQRLDYLEAILLRWRSWCSLQQKLSDSKKVLSFDLWQWFCTFHPISRESNMEIGRCAKRINKGVNVAGSSAKNKIRVKSTVSSPARVALSCPSSPCPSHQALHPQRCWLLSDKRRIFTVTGDPSIAIFYHLSVLTRKLADSLRRMPSPHKLLWLKWLDSLIKPLIKYCSKSFSPASSCRVSEAPVTLFDDWRRLGLSTNSSSQQLSLTKVVTMA